MADQFSDGAVVVLKSGGPEMTVRWTDKAECYCEWFDGKKVVGATFTTAQLRLKDSGPKFIS